MTSLTASPTATKTADEINELVRENIKLVWWTLWKCTGIPVWKILRYEHEYLSAGLQGLMLAAESYEELRGCKFDTWALYRIRWTILRANKVIDPKERDIRLVIEADLEGDFKLADVPNPEPGIRPKAPAILDGLLSALPDRERLVIEGRWGIAGPEMTLAELGGVMGISRERVRQIEAKAFGKLQHAARQRRHAS